MMNSPAPWVGNTSQQLQVGGLNVRPNSPFYLTHHPRGWDLVLGPDGPEWLPQFSKLIEEAGVNGVRSVPGGADSSHARTRAQDKGKTVLPWSLGYLVKHSTKSGQSRFGIRWSVPKDMAGTVIWKLDHVAYNNWRRGLLAEGIIKPPDPDYIELLMREERRNLERLYERQHIPEVQQKMESIREKMRNMEAAIAPKPTPKRGRKK